MKLNRRPFAIGDMMALVAAAALGFALDRWRLTELSAVPAGATGESIGASHWLHVLNSGRPSCIIFALALVLVLLRWLGPRPTARRTLRQPGAVACLVIVGTLVANVAIIMIGEAIKAWMRSPDPPMRFYSNWYYWGQAVHFTQMTVVGAWVALALGGRWSPEKSWIDRLGIALGLYWVAIYILGYFSKIISVWFPYK